MFLTVAFKSTSSPKAGVEVLSKRVEIAKSIASTKIDVSFLLFVSFNSPIKLNGSNIAVIVCSPGSAFSQITDAILVPLVVSFAVTNTVVFAISIMSSR